MEQLHQGKVWRSWSHQSPGAEVAQLSGILQQTQGEEMLQDARQPDSTVHQDPGIDAIGVCNLALM